MTTRNTSAYKVLAAQLREAIFSGSFPPDAPLPTESELAIEHGLSRQTVRQAYRELVGEGLVYRVRGRGSFSTPTSGRSYVRAFGPIQDLLALAAETTVEVVEPLQLRTDAEAAGRLRQATDQVMTLRLRRYQHGLVYCSTQVYLPVEIGLAVQANEALTTTGVRTTVTVLSVVEASGIPIAGAHQSIMAVPAAEPMASWVEAPPGSPLLRIDRLYFTRSGQLVDLAITHFNPDRYSYRVDLRRTDH